MLTYTAACIHVKPTTIHDKIALHLRLAYWRMPSSPEPN